MVLPWADMPFLLALAREGTLSATARLLKADRTTISRRLDQLENSLNEPLFERFKGRFSLTSYGRRVFAAAESAEQELMVMTRQGDGRHDYGGKIRVSLSEHLLMTLTDCFHGFMRDHPNIFLELAATDRAVDLNRFESDVALRICRSMQDGLMAKRIGKPIPALYRRRDCDGAELRYIARPSEYHLPRYVLKYAPRAKLCLSVDGLVSMRELIASGAGIGILPRYFGDRDPRIVCCSEALPNPGFTLFIVFRPEQRRLHHIKTFVDHVHRHLAGMAGFESEEASE